MTALTKEIYVPLVNETISIGEQTQSHSISLSESLLSSLSSQWAKVGLRVMLRISKMYVGANPSPHSLKITRLQESLDESRRV